ncbi:RDD family protein [Shewanella sp. AS1]|uniref:RDD family protein n=1 Tax=Shewanella sp. AS1 TaxID=2907626 RepID=UPI0022785F50
MITPFAFNVAQGILYTPLASPLKRGLAILIDGLIVAVLADQAGWLFLLFVGVTLLIERRSHQIGRFFKWGLYLSMLVMGLYVTSDNIIEYRNAKDEQAKVTQNSVKIEDPDAAAIVSLIDIWAIIRCEEFTCIEKHYIRMANTLNNTSLTQSKKRKVLSDLLDELELSEAEKLKLQAIRDDKIPLVQANMPRSSTQATNEQSTHEQGTGNQGEALNMHGDGEANSVGTSSDLELGKRADKEQAYSLLNWAKGILDDLGLGFGWAAFYFTVFIAWFDGQTLGKKLLNIRVIRLDAAPISLWAAFGRYGGYGAGFATGLLGFMQIYWDANRQAIQDKISATVVIDLSKTSYN